MTERSRAAIRQAAAALWDGTATDPDSSGLLLRGREYRPVVAEDLDPLVLNTLLRLARLAAQVADGLRDCPDARVRRSAAVVAARAHPLRAAFDG